jgi:fimbrial isopeptide formation D2 family protein
LSGTAFTDANGDGAQGGGEPGTNAGGLFAVLTDNAGTVLEVKSVATNGTYSFAQVTPNTDVKLLVTAANPALGSTVTSAVLPSGWTNTTPSILAFNTGSSSVTDKNFGLDRLPETDNKTVANQLNPTGNTQFTAPSLTGSDPENGAIGAGNTFKITMLPVGGTLYYDGLPVVLNQPITNYDPTKLKVDPADATTSLSFMAAAIDGANQADSTPATITMGFTPVGPPVAYNNYAQSLPNAVVGDNNFVIINILGNDSAATNATLVPGSVDLDPATPGQQTSLSNSNGSFVLQPDGTVKFTPALGVSGVVITIPYTVQDNFGQTSNAANLSAEVNIPAANPDTAIASFNTPVTFGAGGVPAVAVNDITVAGRTIEPSTVDLDPGMAGQQTIFSVMGKGTFILDAGSGNVTFTPDTGFFGTVTIPYTIQDSAGLRDSSPANITVTVNPPAPDAKDDPSSTLVNTPKVIDALGNDVGPGINAASVTVPASGVGAPSRGVVTVALDGKITYTPNPGVSGVDTFTYTVCNTAVPTPVCDTATVTINITPQATPDSATTPSGSSVTFPVAANDVGSIDPTKIDLDPSTPAIDPSLTVPGKGIFTTQPDGTVTFVPEAGFSGPVTPISYTVQDTSGLISSSATITVTVTPKATNDTAITEVGLPVKTDVLANDKGSLDPATLTVTVNPVHGSVTVNSDGTITYTPALGYSGADTYTYQVCDTSGQCTTATVAVTVGVVAKPDTDTTTLGMPVTTNVLTNDLGNLNVGSVTVPSNPSHGSVVVNPSGTITYTPAPGFSGTDTYTYKVCDTNDSNNCSSNTVTIAVAPVAVNDTATTDAGTPVTFAVSSNDLGGVDPASIDLDPVSPGRQDSLTVANQGTFTANDDGTVKFTPADGFSGPVSTIPYTIKTPGGIESAPANLNINVTPLAANDPISTPSNQSIDIPVLANDKGTIDPSSLDLDPNTVGIQTTFTVPEGVFTLNPDNTVKFVPTPGFAGAVTPITYAVKDTSAQITTATIAVSVGIAAPPSAQADPASTTAGTPVTFKPLLNDTAGTYPIDPTKIDLDPSTPTIDSGYTIPNQGTFTADSSGNITFTPAPGFSGPVTPTPYTVADAYNNTSAPVNMTVTVTPKAIDDTASTPAGTSIKVAVSINDLGNLDLTSIDLDPNMSGIQTTLTVSGQGTFLANPDGTVKFTPADGFSGPVTAIPYTIADTSAQRTPSASITITVTPKPVDDDAATYTNNPVDIAVLTNDKGNLDPATLDLDPSTPGVQLSATTPSGTVSLNPDHSVKYTPNTGFEGTDSFGYRVCDQAGQCANATVAVTVSPNLPPVAQAHTESEVNSNATLKLAPLQATDADGIIKSYTVSSLPDSAMGVLYVSDPASGGALVAVGQILTPAQAASLYFKPNPSFFGTASFKFTATDDKGAVDATPAVVTIPVNAAPVAKPDSASTTLGTPVTIPVLSNDTDADGTLVLGSIDLDPSTPAVDSSITVPGKGTFTAQPDGTVTFSPEPGFSGPVTTLYTVQDDHGATSNSASMTVTVTAGTVKGHVFTDLNGDGTQQPNEPDQASAPVVITDSLGRNSTVITDASGNYSVLVAPGATTVNVTDPANSRLTTGNNPQTVVVTDGGTTQTTPVGFQPLEGQVTGRVFEDKNGNGKFDDGEGLLGVTVRITDPVKKDASGNPVVYTVQTDANGSYSKSGVSVGDAVVDIDDTTLPAAKPGESNWVQTIGTDPSTVSVQPNAVNDAGLDGYNRPRILVTKEALSSVAVVGGSVDWRITVVNAGFADLREITITDTLPKGLAYKKGTSLIVGGAKIADPTVDPQNSRTIIWKLSSSLLKPGQKLAIGFTTTITPEAQPGKLENTAGASAQTGATTSTVTARSASAVAAIKIELGVFTNKTVIVGRVYFDTNDNNSFESDTDKPLEGARVYMSDGRFAVTDAQGRYSLPDVDPGLHALRLDPLTAPYTPKAVPDDQGQRGSRYARATEFGGIVTKDFPLVAPNGALAKNRSTTVTRGPVKLEKTVQHSETGYAIQTVISLQEAVANLSITDPLPKDATRGALSLVSSDGRNIPVEVSADGQAIRIPGVLERGTYTLTYAIFSGLPPELIVTDPSISYEEVIR